MKLLVWIAEATGKALGAFTRLFRRHSQPCGTCRRAVAEYEAALEEWEGRFLEAMSKYRAQYARLVQREKKLLEDAGYLAGEGDAPTPQEAQNPSAPEPGTPEYKHALRQRARHLGVL